MTLESIRVREEAGEAWYCLEDVRRFLRIAPSKVQTARRRGLTIRIVRLRDDRRYAPGRPGFIDGAGFVTLAREFGRMGNREIRDFVRQR